MPTTAEDFRATLARWASGVSVVTARDGERLVGMTVSAFCSVSLAPPLVLICASISSETSAVIHAHGMFAVNILAQHQQALSERFSDPQLEGRRFEDLGLHWGASGLPLLAETVASLECRVVHSSVQGDHRVYVAEVLHTNCSERAPLLHFKSSYGALLNS